MAWGTARAVPHARAGSRAGVALLAAALVLGGCVSPFGEDDETSDEPEAELSQPAEGEVVQPPETPAEETTTGGSTDGTAGAGTTAGTGGTGNTTATTAGGEKSAARVVLQVGDPAGDADTPLDDSPPYADALQVSIETVGDDARVTVRVGAALPGALADGEVVGIGIDFYRSGALESDYQLFADGGVDGWRAFLQTPDGFIDYPGAFGVSGDLVQFRVPWSALGGEPTGTVAGFLDWSAREDLGLVTSTADQVPDRGAANYR